MKPVITFLCLLYILNTAAGQNAQITAPSSVILSEDSIKIDCQPAGNQYGQINALNILKNGQSLISAGIVSGVTNVAWSNTNVQNRATRNNPDLSTVAAAQLTITISASNVQCNDEAVYTCRVQGLDSGFNPVTNNEQSKNVTVTAKPLKMEEITATPSPSTGGQYSAGVNITLTCSGNVGSYSDPPQMVWCIEREGDFSQSPLDADINFVSVSHSNVIPAGLGPTEICQQNRTSTVVYTVASSDTSTTFYCQVTAPGDSTVCGQGTIRKPFNIEAASTTQAPGSGGQGSGDTASAGPIAGGVLGGVVVIVVILIVVYVVCIRKKSSGETYRTREEKEGKENATVSNDAPVYSVPDKHGKRGYENKGVDEPHTKPRDRDHRRHDGRGHANPAMYNHDDYDRDGTPEPRNVHHGGPMGSAV